jgi:hypothetical protein
MEARGAFQRHPERRRANEPKASCDQAVKPKLKGRASKIWDEYAPICISMQTLARGDELEFSTWCKLQAQFEKEGDRFTTSRLAQKRAYAERFGIAGAGSRAKVVVPRGEEKSPMEDLLKRARTMGNTAVN